MAFVPSEALTGGLSSLQSLAQHFEEIMESLEEGTLSYFSLEKKMIKKKYENSLPLEVSL